MEIRAWLQERVGPIDWAAYDKANYLSEQKFNFEGLPRLEIEGQEPSKPAPEKPAPKAQVIEPQDPVNVFLDLITSKGDLLERLRRWKEAKAKGNAEPKPLEVTEAERIEGIIKKTEGVGPHLPKIRLDPAQIIILDEPSFVQSSLMMSRQRTQRGVLREMILKLFSYSIAATSTWSRVLLA